MTNVTIEKLLTVAGIIAILFVISYLVEKPRAYDIVVRNDKEVLQDFVGMSLKLSPPSVSRHGILRWYNKEGKVYYYIIPPDTSVSIMQRQE
jgi:hypothetical protein